MHWSHWSPRNLTFFVIGEYFFCTNVDFVLNYSEAVTVTGSVSQRTYTDKNGVEKFSTKVVAEKMDMLNSRTEGAAPAKAAPEPEPFNEDDIPF